MSLARSDPKVWSRWLRRFADAECRGLSPLYETLARALAKDEALLGWMTTVMGPRARPTLPFAAVHYLLLGGTNGGGLDAFYPNLTRRPEHPGDAYPAFRAFVLRERERLAPLLATRGTQTNEVARCTYLLPSFVWVAARTERPLWIVDVGCSAGLNLAFDRYAYDYGGGWLAGDRLSKVTLRTERRGARFETGPMPTVAGRVGVDLDPIRPNDEDATRWLEACTWPEHVDRLVSLRAALAMARQHPLPVVQGNALDLLPGLADAAHPDALLVVVNTNVMFYFSADERVRYGRLLETLSMRREVAWIANEHPSLLAAAGLRLPIDQPADPAALPLVLTMFADGERTEELLAHVGPHGRWLHWLGPSKEH